MVRSMVASLVAVVLATGAASAGTVHREPATLLVASADRMWWLREDGMRTPIAGTAAFGGSSHARVSPARRSTLLLATGGRLASGDVVLYLLERGRARQIAAWADSPAWSPDGRRFAYVEYGTDLDCVAFYSQAVVVRTAAPPASTRRPAGVSSCSDVWWDANPSWSPDGSALAFHRLHHRRTARDGIYVVRASGGGARRIVSGSSPEWSSRGQLIAFRRAGVLFTHDVRQGITLRRGHLGTSEWYGPLRWSPDGHRIAYSLQAANGSNEAWILDLRTSKRTRLARGYVVLDWPR